MKTSVMLGFLLAFFLLTGIAGLSYAILKDSPAAAVGGVVVAFVGSFIVVAMNDEITPDDEDQ